MDIITKTFEDVFEEVNDIILLVCAIGFEKRSSYIAHQVNKKLKLDNNKILCFYFSDNRNEVSQENYNFIKSLGITPIDADKNKHNDMIEVLISRIEELTDQFKKINIHIDYSSMPRNWYANILLKTSEKIRKEDNLYFWYSHGDYTNDVKHCSTAGADDFLIFSGKSSIKPKNRSHIFGLGYDKIKSDAIRTVVDPSTLIICYTYPKGNKIICETIQKEHRVLFDASAFSFSLPIEDFSFIIKRIKEVVIDLSDRGDVILIPDGPKPLILACSMIPKLINKTGIICFHVKSHSDNFLPENIKPTGDISGFKLNKK